MYQMNLNSANVISRFKILNSGNCWYFWNSASHSSWLVGGFISFIKCQSTIERPDSVNLVTPPRITAPATVPLQTSSHRPTTRSAAFEGRDSVPLPDCKATSEMVLYCPGLKARLIPQLQPHCVLGAARGARSRRHGLPIKAFKGGKSNLCMLRTVHAGHCKLQHSPTSSHCYQKEKHFRVTQRDPPQEGRAVTAPALGTRLSRGLLGRGCRGRAGARSAVRMRFSGRARRHRDS